MKFRIRNSVVVFSMKKSYKIQFSEVLQASSACFIILLLFTFWNVIIASILEQSQVAPDKLDIKVQIYKGLSSMLSLFCWPQSFLWKFFFSLAPHRAIFSIERCNLFNGAKNQTVSRDCSLIFRSLQSQMALHCCNCKPL